MNLEKNIKIALDNLDVLSTDHLNFAKRMAEAHDGDFYGMDLLANGALNRSMALTSGFSMLISSHNLLSAGALLRLELDTALRFSGAWLVESPHKFALAILDGEKVRNMKDKSGKKMHDAYLVSRLKADYPWIPRVYERTSGYVHFSSVHLFAAITMDQNSESIDQIGVRISPKDKPNSIELYLEAIEAFIESAKLLLKYIHGWTYTKDNPEEIAKMRKLKSTD